MAFFDLVGACAPIPLKPMARTMAYRMTGNSFSWCNYIHSYANDAIFFLVADLLWMQKYSSMLVKLIQKVYVQSIAPMEKMLRNQDLILSLLW